MTSPAVEVKPESSARSIDRPSVNASNTMKTLLFVAFSALAVQIGDAEEFSIDNWDFDWKVAESDKATLVFRKNAESTVVMIRENFDGIDLSPDDAENVGRVLLQTNAKASALKGSTGKSEKIAAGKFTVSFYTGDSGSFYVSVKRDQQFSFRDITLNREQALAFAPHMARARRMAAHLDKMVNPTVKAIDPKVAKELAETSKAQAERAVALAEKAKADAEKAAAVTALLTAKRDAAQAAEEIETSAGKKLSLAKTLYSRDKAAGKKRLKEIVDHFDGTIAAEEAAALLKKD